MGKTSTSHDKFRHALATPEPPATVRDVIHEKGTPLVNCIGFIDQYAGLHGIRGYVTMDTREPMPPSFSRWCQNTMKNLEQECNKLAFHSGHLYTHEVSISAVVV